MLEELLDQLFHPLKTVTNRSTITNRRRPPASEHNSLFASAREHHFAPSLSNRARASGHHDFQRRGSNSKRTGARGRQRSDRTQRRVRWSTSADKQRRRSVRSTVPYV